MPLTDRIRVGFDPWQVGLESDPAIVLGGSVEIPFAATFFREEFTPATIKCLEVNSQAYSGS